jgi:hypothetical protein
MGIALAEFAGTGPVDAPRWRCWLYQECRHSAIPKPYAYSVAGIPGAAARLSVPICTCCCDWAGSMLRKRPNLEVRR